MLTVLLFFATLNSGSNFVSAQTINTSWNATANGSWEDSTNWSDGVPNNGSPTSSDLYDATIEVSDGDEFAVSITGNNVIENFTLDSPNATVSLASDPFGTPGSTPGLTVNNELNVGSGSLTYSNFSIGFSDSPTFDVATISQSGGSVELISFPSFGLSGGIEIGEVNQTGGTFNSSGTLSNTTVNQSGGDFEASGTFDSVTFNGALNVVGDLSISGETTFNGQVNVIRNSGTSGVNLRYSGTAGTEPEMAILGGNATLNLDAGAFGGRLVANQNVNLTIAPGVTIRGEGGLESEGFGTENNPTIINQGLILADIGEPGNSLGIQLSSGGSFINQGDIGASNGASLILNVSSGTFAQESGRLFVDNGTIDTTNSLIELAAGALAGNGTIDGNNAGGIRLGGELDPGFTSGRLTGRLNIDGQLEFLEEANSKFQLGGTTAGATDGGYDQVVVTRDLLLDGDLQIEFVEGFEFSISATDEFTLFQSNSLSGQFSNIANGEFLTTTDGSFEFQVHYGAGSAFNENAVVLSNLRAVAIPEPSTCTLVIAGILGAFAKRRRSLLR